MGRGLNLVTMLRVVTLPRTLRVWFGAEHQSGIPTQSVGTRNKAFLASGEYIIGCLALTSTDRSLLEGDSTNAS